MTFFIFMFVSLVASGSAVPDHDMERLRNTGGAYPANFPVVLGVDGGVPEFSFEHDWEMNRTYDPLTDNGGYRYNYLFKADMNKWDFSGGGFCFNCGLGNAQYLIVNTYKITAAQIGLSGWNCSMEMEQSDWTGVVNTVKVCAAGSCCKAMEGLPLKSKKIETVHLALDVLIGGGLCKDFSEDMYCHLVGGGYHTSCLQAYTAPVGRIYPIVPCFDVFYEYWMSCPVYKKSGYETAASVEPPAYNSKLTFTDMTIFFTLTQNADRVCLPASYYAAADAAEVEESAAGTLTSLASTFVCTRLITKGHNEAIILD